MKFKKALLKITIVGSIFFISAISFTGIISLQDDDINNFWSIQKLDISFLTDTYAESWDRESGDSKRYKKESYKKESYKKESYKKESYNKKSISFPSSTDNATISYPSINIHEPEVIEPVVESIVEEKKQILLNEEEKQEIDNRFLKVKNLVNKKYSSGYKKLNIYKKLSKLLDEKIDMLNTVKEYVKNEELFEKYEKKVLLLEKLNTLSQEQILLYIDYIELNFDDEIGNNSKKIEEPIVKQNNEWNNQQKIAEAERISAQQKAAKLAAERKVAEIARIAAQKSKIEAQRIAAQKEAQRIAAQKAAQEKANTNTHAS